MLVSEAVVNGGGAETGTLLLVNTSFKFCSAFSKKTPSTRKRVALIKHELQR